MQNLKKGLLLPILLFQPNNMNTFSINPTKKHQIPSLLGVFFYVVEAVLPVALFQATF